jgi:hypothetical protein
VAGIEAGATRAALTATVINRRALPGRRPMLSLSAIRWLLRIVARTITGAASVRSAMSAYEGIEEVAATGAAAIAGLANVIAASTRAVMDPIWKIFAMTKV